MNLKVRHKQTGFAPRGVALFVCCLLLAACHKGRPPLRDDHADSAAQTMLNAEARHSERGKLQFKLEAPIIKKYNKPIEKTLYLGTDRQRVRLTMFDDEEGIRTVIEAGEAVSYDSRDLMEAKDSVVVIDFTNGDTVYLQDLIWNAAEDRIYSEHRVRSRNGKRLTEGDAFTTDQRMEHLQIIHQRGIIEFED